MKKSLYLLLGLLLFCGIYQACAPEELPGSIYGTVMDKATGEPIKSAGVTLTPNGATTVTGSDGHFEFTDLTHGGYAVVITKTGYQDTTRMITVKSGETTPIDIQLEKLPPALKVMDDNRKEIDTLDFGSSIDDVARSFSIFNDGTESLEWQITTTAEWIKSVSKKEGVLSAGMTQPLIITIDRTKLGSGENKTTVHITSNNGSKQLVAVAVNDFQATKLNVIPTTDIKSTSATLHGEVVEDGNPIYTERGFVYAETTQPTINTCIQKIAVHFSNSKIFAATVTGLTLGKKYYVRTYAIQSGNEVYSANEVSFVAKGNAMAKVVTKSVTDIFREEGKITVLGEIIEDGDPAYSERGFVYGTTKNLSIANGTKVEVKNDGNSEYSAVLSDLVLGNVYYIRAYAINTEGVAYGEELIADFNPIKPAVTTNDVTAIADDGTATFNATITKVGDPVYSERGFVYSKSTNPLIGSAKQVQVAGAGDGAYYKNMEGLDVNIPYYVRAYLIYSRGTIYGEEKTFSIQKNSAPTVVTSSVSNISYTSATAGGVVTSDGGEDVTERGVVYSTTENPTINNTKISNGVGMGTFSCELTELKEGSTYYVRAYAINVRGISYGEQVSFTTKTQMLATLTTTEVIEITETTAVTGGEVTNDGGATVTERGVVYSTSQNPTTSNSKIANGSGVGSFICNLTNLKPNTTYYVRAYAINSAGTAYGTQVTFTTTHEISLPSIKTTSVAQITKTSAIISGNVTSDGGASLMERGIVYSTIKNPTITNNKVTSVGNLGSFSVNITNLQEGTTYYARAYAINIKGIAYGQEISFTSLGNQTFTINGVSFTMINVEGGTFTMGKESNDMYCDECPAHTVSLSDYYIGATEVTQELWFAVVDDFPSYFYGLQNPVENITWEDCQIFITKLNQLTGKTFRLPTEAEWEYAARGGKLSKGYEYAGSNNIVHVAWYYNNSNSTTHPVSQRQPNELGIYDMSGNVWEWCQDWYSDYTISSQKDPKGPQYGTTRVYRGGSWRYGDFGCTITKRGNNSPTAKMYDVGVRLVLTP